MIGSAESRVGSSTETRLMGDAGLEPVKRRLSVPPLLRKDGAPEPGLKRLVCLIGDAGLEPGSSTETRLDRIARIVR